MNNACPICQKISVFVEVLFENEFCLFLPMVEKNNPGAGLIVTRDHLADWDQINDEQMMKLFQLLKEIKLAINLKFHPQGFHLAWNQGLVAGQKVPHVHLTIIPRYKEEPFAGKSLDHWLDSPENRRREPVLEQQILDDLALFLED